MTFSEKLKHWQIELDMSQKELSEVLYNIPTRTIQSWFLGEKEPSQYIQLLIEFRVSSYIKNLADQSLD